MLRAYSKSEGTGKRPAPERRSGAPDVGRDYAAHLLADFGFALPPSDRAADDAHPAHAWAASGSMALTGAPDGPPAVAPGHVVACARGAVDALAALAERPELATLDAPALLAERAALLGLSRGGTTSAGGPCRL